jgi:hypothetical protein
MPFFDGRATRLISFRIDAEPQPETPYAQGIVRSESELSTSMAGDSWMKLREWIRARASAVTNAMDGDL